MTPVSEIKLIRTDTTLDLSQKAEKVWVVNLESSFISLDFVATNFVGHCMKHNEKILVQ